MVISYPYHRVVDEVSKVYFEGVVHQNIYFRTSSTVPLANKRKTFVPLV